MLITKVGRFTSDLHCSVIIASYQPIASYLQFSVRLSWTASYCLSSATGADATSLHLVLVSWRLPGDAAWLFAQNFCPNLLSEYGSAATISVLHTGVCHQHACNPCSQRDRQLFTWLFAENFCSNFHLEYGSAAAVSAICCCTYHCRVPELAIRQSGDTDSEVRLLHHFILSATATVCCCTKDV